MKSIFLAFIITTSVSSLIFTSDASLSGAVAAKKQTTKAMTCPKCRATGDDLFCDQDRDDNMRGFCVRKMTCAWCAVKLVKIQK
jgi:hypothetical protein